MTDPPRSTGADADPRLRALPSVDRLLRDLGESSPRAADAARAVLDAARERLRADGRRGESAAATADRAQDGPAIDPGSLLAEVVARLDAAREGAYPRVVNATGIFLHTGLGRAPLAADAVAALAATAGGFQQLEVDPATGERRHREAGLLPDLRALTGGAAATVVNNNAAALLLALSALAAGRSVLVSRGELIEIGGGFRLPEMMRLSGARLVEVGSTNRTEARDYQAAVTADTALILRVHTSNFRVVGFQHSPSREELVALARAHGLVMLEDLGSGLLQPTPGPLASEPDVRSALAAGVDLTCFSGDKLLGGPQAGLLVGREDLVARCRRHPLFRAVRPDRLQLTALGATLSLLASDPLGTPVREALARGARDVMERAQALAARLAARFPDARFAAQPSEAQAGSGSLPARPLPSAAVEVSWPGLDAEALAAALREGRPAVWASAGRGVLRLDVLALLAGDDERIVQAFSRLGTSATHSRSPLRGGSTT
jgi:L-seryl-tRNA(Ser) seleniumtransferase